ncbi:hypothetical protein DPSP01_001364 [Paraphaeosphaeria sporulosa]
MVQTLKSRSASHNPMREPCAAQQHQASQATAATQMTEVKRSALGGDKRDGKKWCSAPRNQNEQSYRSVCKHRWKRLGIKGKFNESRWRNRRGRFEVSKGAQPTAFFLRSFTIPHSIRNLHPNTSI